MVLLASGRGRLRNSRSTGSPAFLPPRRCRSAFATLPSSRAASLRIGQAHQWRFRVFRHYEGTVGTMAHLWAPMWSRRAILSALPKFSYAWLRAKTLLLILCLGPSRRGLLPQPNGRSRGIATGQHLCGLWAALSGQSARRRTCSIEKTGNVLSRQNNIRDARIEYFHERSESDHYSDEPGLTPGAPLAFSTEIAVAPLMAIFPFGHRSTTSARKW